MPRAYYGARLPDGSRLGAPAKALCSYLWGFVPAVAKMRKAGPHFVYHDQERLAAALDVGVRAISEHLTQLRELGAVSSGVLEGRWGYWLHTIAGFEDDGQPPDAFAAAAPGGGRSLGDRAPNRANPRGDVGRSTIDHVGDRRSIASSPTIDRVGDRRSIASSPTIDRVEIGDRSRGRSAIDRVAPKEEQDHEQELNHAAAELETRVHEQAAAAPLDLLGLARQLLAELAAEFTPPGIPQPLQSSDARTVHKLRRLLDPGVRPVSVVHGQVEADARLQAAIAERLAAVRATLLEFAAVCRADPAQARWWDGGMFDQERGPKASKSRWEAVEFTVAKARRERAAQAEADKQRAVRAAEPPPAPARPVDLAAVLASETSSFAQHLRAATQAPSPAPAPPPAALEPDLASLTDGQLLEMREQLSDAMRDVDESTVRDLSRTRLAVNRELADRQDSAPFHHVLTPHLGSSNAKL